MRSWLMDWYNWKVILFWLNSILVIFHFGSCTLKVSPCEYDTQTHWHTHYQIKSQFNPQQKLTFLLWSSLAIVTSTSLSSADIFTSSSDLNYLLYSTSIEMLCLARQSQLALRVKKYIPLALHLINTYEMCIKLTF